MSDERMGKTDERKASDGDDIIAALLTLPGPRASVDKATKDRVYANVRKEWRQSTAKRSALRWALPAALAASVLVAVFVARSPPAVDAARPLGSIVLVAEQSAASAYTIGQAVLPGDVLDTLGGGGLSVVLNGNTSLRLDRDSLLTVDAKDEFTLVSGRVYVDTGPAAYGKTSITVHTATGSAVDIGTQFSVTFSDADMSVAVREGQVDLSSSDDTHIVPAGNRVMVRPGAPVVSDTIAITGDEWAWAVSLAPAFEVQDRNFLEFLKWAARESGLELEFATDELRMIAMGVEVIHPVSISGTNIEEAIESIFATTDFSYSIDGNRLTVSR